MAITVLRIYRKKRKKFAVSRAGVSIWESKEVVDDLISWSGDRFIDEAEIREYRLVPVDPAECPDCHQMWPENEVILASGELGCSCKLDGANRNNIATHG